MQEDRLKGLFRHTSMRGKKMICIEGPDNSGKTTLAKTLSQHLGLPIHHSGGPPKLESEVEGRCRMLSINPSPFILDRYPAISEMVYGPLLRPHLEFTSGTDWVDRSLKSGWIFIYCRPSDEHLLSLEGHVLKEHETPEHFEQVKKRAWSIITTYDDIMSLVPHFRYNFETTSPTFINRLTYFCRRYAR